ncbi:hypothetical protein K8942_00470 [Candidatus Peribacteria bacterium]|nr:MAG: hypothetical protein K8942_00470 [Candidatus Peribacteria bacterium]
MSDVRDLPDDENLPEDTLFLPPFPDDDAIESMMLTLHELFIRRMSESASKPEQKAILESLSAKDLRLQLKSSDEDDLPSTLASRQSTGTYKPDNHPDAPVFGVDAWYKNPNMNVQTDQWRLTNNIFMGLDLIGEVIASMQQEMRQTLVDFLVATYAEDCGLDEFLEDMDDDDCETEDGDIAYADDEEEEKDAQKTIAEVRALMDLRKAVTNGSFGHIPDIDLFYETDQLDRSWNESLISSLHLLNKRFRSLLSSLYEKLKNS